MCMQADAGESEYEKNARLSRFQGSAAISSADYFGRKQSGEGQGGMGDMDVSASDLVRGREGL